MTEPYARAIAIGLLFSLFGDTDLQTSGGINAVRTFESMFGFLEARIIGTVHGSVMDVGDAQKQPELMRAAYELGRKIACWQG
jgi:hypothetical protein